MFAKLDVKQWLIASVVVFALLFTFVYSHGLEGKPGLGQGLWYGLFLGLLIYRTPILLLQAFTLLPKTL